MTDKRTYIRVHDGMDEHPKIEPLSDKAFRVLMTTWFWCSRNKTNGRVPETSWIKRGTKRVRAELEAELVHRPGHGCPDCPPVPGGYVLVHDYLEHQRSTDQIDAAIEKKRLGGVMGNHRRWHVNGYVDPDCEFCHPPDAPPPRGSDDRSHNRSDQGRITDPDPIGYSDTEDRGQRTEKELLTFSTNGHPGNRARPKPPTPAELAATAHSPMAHRLVVSYAADCRKRPPSSVLTDLAVQVDALLAENWTPDELAPVIAAWGAKGLHPKAFASVAHEVANSEHGNVAGQRRPVTGSPRLDKAMGYLAPGDPLLAHLGGDAPNLTIIEGGQTA